MCIMCVRALNSCSHDSIILFLSILLVLRAFIFYSSMSYFLLNLFLSPSVPTLHMPINTLSSANVNLIMSAGAPNLAEAA